MDPRRSVGRATGGVDRDDPLLQRGVRGGAQGRLPLVPRPIPARGDAEHTARADHRMGGLQLLDELILPHGSELVSRAKKAAAFTRISRSSRRIVTTRRKRRNSASSSVVSPSCRSPASSSACRSQARSASSEMPSSCAIAVFVFPLLRTRRMASAPDSAQYRGSILGTPCPFLGPSPPSPSVAPPPPRSSFSWFGSR